MDKILKQTIEDQYDKLVKGVEQQLANNKTISLMLQICEQNKSKMYDPKNDEFFERDFGFTDDETGEEYPEYSFDYGVYEEYKEFMKNYDSLIANLNFKQNMLEHGKVVLNRDKKLKQVNEELESAKKRYKMYKKIEIKETNSDKAKKENKAIDDTIYIVKNNLIKKEIKKLLLANPNYVNLNMDQCRLAWDVLKLTKECQEEIKNNVGEKTIVQARDNISKGDQLSLER